MRGDSGIIGAVPVLTSGDIVGGLGAAPRELLASCLALFDDSTLHRRLGTLVDRWTSGKGKDAAGLTDAETAAAVQTSLQAWQNSALSDDALRVLLWMYLRDAFGLPATTFASLRSAGTAADDVVARALNILQPGVVTKIAEQWGLKNAKELPTNLDALARNTMKEMLASFLDTDDPESVQAREHLLAETRTRLGQLPPEDRKRLMQAAGTDDLNDAALRNILLTGGGLGVLGASVSLAGFSAYILAAQASAFIPLVSGPALVSVVAVLSNPITIIAATAGMGWWATRSANQKVRGAVGVRVLSLLALNGVDAGAAGIRAMLNAFTALGDLSNPGSLSSVVLVEYREDWRGIAPARRKATVLHASVATVMERPLDLKAGDGRLRGLMGADSREQRDTVLLAGLTLGDVLYNAYSLDPAVLQAADFARVEDLDDPVAFADFAHAVESMDPGANLGAVSNLKGYVAERVVAAQLVEQGHVVEFPGASNQAGWDISVDGTKFQIKDLNDLSGLEHHFDRGYDYPVIANSELAEKLAERTGDHAPDWADHVHFVEGYSNEVVEHVSRASLDAGDDMLHPHVPLFTVVLSGIRNFGRMNRNEITGSQAVQEVLLDGGTRAGLAIVGNYMGAGVGLLVFGPAGALVLGSVMPILSQRQSGRLKGELDKLIKDKTYVAWSEETRKAFARLTARSEALLKAKAELLQCRQPGDSQDFATRYVQWRQEQELCFLREAWCRLQSIREDKSAPIELATSRVMSWLSTSTLHPSAYQAELAVLSDEFKRRPSTADRVSDVTRRAANEALKIAGEIGKALGGLWGSLGNTNGNKKKH